MRGLMAAYVAIGMMMGQPGAAQDYASRYTINGQYDLIVNGEPLTAFTTFDTERGRSSVERRETLGKVFYNVNGSRPDAEGNARGLVSVQLWPDRVSDIQYRDNGLFGADLPGGAMTLDAPPQIDEDGAIAFSFRGTLIQFEIKDGDFVPVPGAATVEISGSYSGQYPVE